MGFLGFLVGVIFVFVFVVALDEVIKHLYQISESLSFLADHIQHSCEKCQQEQEGPSSEEAETES